MDFVLVAKGLWWDYEAFWGRSEGGDVGVAEVSDGKVVGWTEKPKLNIHSGIGILALDAGVLGELERLSERYDGLDIMSHFIPHLIEEGEPVCAYVTDAFWCDVGSTERYEKLDNSAVDEYLSSLLVK